MLSEDGFNFLATLLKPELLTETLGVFHDDRLFYDYRRYRDACRYLNTFFRLLSAIHFPTKITPSDYPRARTLGDWSKVFEHQNREINPYIEYYEKVLFPLIEADPPLVIGISMVFGAQSVQTLVLGRMLKKRFPGIHVTMGGAYLSQWVLIMEKSQLRDFFSCTDSVICGEGEKPFRYLLGRIDTHRAWWNYLAFPLKKSSAASTGKPSF